MIGRRSYSGGREFAVVIADLLAEPSDGIVNAANGGLSHGGGVAAAISTAAGPALDREGDQIVRERGRLAVGEAVVTTAGRLRFEGVVHAVGPRFGEGDEEEKLVAALGSAFLRAHERGWASLSFPAVSSGIFAVPPDICTRAYCRAVDGFFEAYPDSPLRTIRLALFAGPVAEAVRAQMESRE